MPQFVVLIRDTTTPHVPGAETPAKEVCDDHAGAMAAAGTMTHAWAFTPKEDAWTIDAAGRTRSATGEGGSAVVGVYVLECPDVEAALAVAATNPVIAAGGSVEVRPVHSGGAVA